MSGIAAIIHFDGRPVAPAEIQKMTASMAHRGPDGVRHWTRNHAALGHCMLCTTPESMEEHQPWANEDESIILVMDGRVDNCDELRVHLIGCGTPLRNRSDAELLLRAYEKWGESCLDHVDGDYAIVIWDARSGRAFCARDRMGGRPLLYHRTGTSLVVASDLPAILNLSWVPRILNWPSLAEYASDEWCSLSSTVWTGIERLDAAHWMTVSRAGTRLERYWKPELIPELRCSSPAGYVEQYRAVLFEAVRRASRSHAPVAYEVSGGLDSSSVSAVAASLNRSGRLAAPRMEAYTLDFCGDPGADELEYARAVCAHLSMHINQVKPAIPHAGWHHDWAARYLECPPFPNWTMGQELYALARAHGARVVVTGLGGDEWLDGCVERYREEFRVGRWGQWLSCARQDVSGRGAAWFARQMLKLLAPESFLSARSRWLARRRASSRPDVLTPQARRRWMSRRSAGPRLQRKNEKFGILRDPYIRLAGEWSERQLSHAGLEIRNPLRSRGIVEFAFAVPERLLSVGMTDRWLHRQTIGDLLPETVRQRLSKAEFSTVYRRALAGLPDDFVHQAGALLAGLIDRAGLAALHESISRKDTGQIFPMAFQLWGVFGCMCLVQAAGGREAPDDLCS